MYGSLAELNSHFKESHPPVICDICKESFNTPSTLSQHKYKHRKLEFSCDQCSKLFPFMSDQHLHMNTHRTIKSFTCVRPKCCRSYFSKGELDKHAKIHSKVLWKCTLCPYSNSDEWNLKVHMRVHSGPKKYLCKNCLQLFKYDTHLHHHLPCLKTVDTKYSGVKHSDSPTF